MWHLSTTACSFYLSKMNSKGNTAIFALNDTLKAVDKNGNLNTYSNFLELVEDFFNTYQISQNDNDARKIFACQYVDEVNKKYIIGKKAKYNFICGIVSSGAYGIKSKIKDINTQMLKYAKTADDADIMDFFVMFVIPHDTSNVIVQKGLLFFQNIGQFGVKTITTKFLREYLKAKLNISFHSGNIAPELYIEKLIDTAILKEIKLIKNNPSLDSSDNIQNGGTYGQETRILSKIKNPLPFWERAKQFIKNKDKTKRNVFEIDDKEYDKTSITVDQNGWTRTIDLHNLDNLSIIESVNKDILLADGSIKVDDLIQHFHEMADYYLAHMVSQITTERG